jgi:D-3-phosphoglycerate dehydrogenase
LLKESDFITLHVTLTPETQGLLGEEQISSMKKGVVIVNTSQGKVIDEKALVAALKSGKIAAAGLDVFAEEPPAKDNPLFTLDNAVFSPHVGFNTVEAAKRCTDICIDNVAKFLEGTVQNSCY